MSRLRGHHLICLNFFRGEGYSQEFAENIREIIESSSLQVVFGPDDVCLKCPHLENKTCMYSENSEEHVTELDQRAYRLLDVYPGDQITWESIKERIPEIMKSWRDFACSDCDWRAVCEENEEWKSL